MKKIIIGVFVAVMLVSTSAYAREIGENRRGSDYRMQNASSTASSTDSTRYKNVDIACVATAVEKREQSIITSWKAMTDKISAALTARKAALLDAWTNTNQSERKAEIKKAHQDAKTAKKEAGKTFKSAKKEAWALFKKESKACGGSVGSEAMGESEAGEKIEI